MEGGAPSEGEEEGEEKEEVEEEIKEEVEEEMSGAEQAGPNRLARAIIW